MEPRTVPTKERRKDLWGGKSRNWTWVSHECISLTEEDMSKNGITTLTFTTTIASPETKTVQCDPKLRGYLPTPF